MIGVFVSVPGGVRIVEEADGIAALEALQVHENPQLYQHALHLIDEFYGEDADNGSMDEKGQTDTEYPAWRLGAQQSQPNQSSQQFNF